MIADNLHQPLHDNLFCRMLNQIQGIDEKDVPVFKKVFDIVAKEQLTKKYHFRFENFQYLLYLINEHLQDLGVCWY